MSDKHYSIMLGDAPWGGPTAHLVSGPEVQFNEGRKAGALDDPFEFVLKVEQDADPAEFPPLDFIDPPRYPLFSTRFVQLLTKLGVDNIEYFAAQVVYEPSGAAVDYQVANVVGAVDGLDRSNSVLIEDGGIIFGIEKIAFDERRFAGQLMFRLGESRSLVVVHDSVRNAIESQGLSGFKFVRDDEWQPGMI